MSVEKESMATRTMFSAVRSSISVPHMACPDNVGMEERRCHDDVDLWLVLAGISDSSSGLKVSEQ